MSNSIQLELRNIPSNLNSTDSALRLTKSKNTYCGRSGPLQAQVTRQAIERWLDNVVIRTFRITRVIAHIPSSASQGYSHNMVSLRFCLFVSVILCISTVLAAVQVHPVARAVSSSATCIDTFSWMNDAQDYSPCLTVAYVEAACIGNDYIQPVLQNNYSYSLPNSSSESPCYCSWSSYNLMMACTLCQGSNFTNSVWTWPTWASGCTANSSWTQEFVQVLWFVELRSLIIDISLLEDMSLLEMRPYLTGPLQIRRPGHMQLSISKMRMLLIHRILLTSLQAQPHHHLAVQVQPHHHLALQIQAQNQLTWVQ
ncbi:uncharacterized protein EDB91DRAFT_315601 [Suillus paluster]|uniref:uncharacterized protein n=1 Tax=Suillus paluster TaxID=48578 RepID=UPI001B8766F3|nr:uncharacterized protein EDB91DRAFT_315601 [Suillus paluster]KAG1741802.1 hypothetical protein EDB91DRAFT_315601 [Suillus paluster]